MDKIGFCFGLTCNMILFVPSIILIFMEKYQEALITFIIVLTIQCCMTGCYMFIKETCKELIKLEVQEDLSSQEFKDNLKKEISRKIQERFHKD